MFNRANVTAGTDGDRETSRGVSTIGEITELVSNLQTIFNAIYIEGLDGRNIKRVSKSLANWDIAIEGTGIVTEHTATSKASTVVLIDVFIFENGAGTIINAFTLSKEWSVIENWFNG